MKSTICTALALLLLLTVGCTAFASGEAVTFPDANMERTVREQLGKANGPIMAADVSGLESLNLSQRDDAPDKAKIRDLSGLEYFKSLKSLNIMNNLIEDISPLAGLKALEELEAPKNLISDLTPLSGLPGIRHAVFWQNRVADLSPVTNLMNLEVFSVTDNLVSDVSPLRGLTKLFILELRGNPIADFSPILDLLPGIKESDGFEAAITGEANASGKPKPEQDAGEPIVFADANLERKVREQLGNAEGPIKPTDVEMLESLNLGQPNDAPDSDKIRDLSGLEHFKSLKSLRIDNNLIEDLNPLSEMWALEELEAPMNRISDLGPIGGLQSIRHAVFWKNQIRDLGHVANLINLEVFSVTDNLVYDISPLQGLNKLDWLELRGNYIIDFSPIRDILPNLSGSDGFEVIMPEDKISFSDPVLEQRVREIMGKPEGDITVGDALKVTDLPLGIPWQEKIPPEIQIRDISALMYFANVFNLALYSNDVEDISALRFMRSLGILNLDGNRISDISPLSGLTEMMILQLSHNRISDLSPLYGMPRLDTLWLAGNPVTDFTPIKDILPQIADRDFQPLFPDDIPETPIEITEPAFEAALRRALDIRDRPITQRDAYMIRTLGLYNEKTPVSMFSDISPLKWFVNLEELEFNSNPVSDISALSGLTNLRILNAGFLQIADLAPLAGLTNLRSLNLCFNPAEDFTPLAGLVNLEWLDLSDTRATDAAPLKNLTALKSLRLGNSPIADFSPLKELYGNLEEKDFNIKK